ncbi:MAG: PAS domain-containing sensor histidine kinase [Candidatus Cyclobacteriaceae bacterium M2_1C_046]
MENRKFEINPYKILDQSLDVLCVFNSEGEFLYVSRSCENVWGYTPEELIQKPYMSLVYETDHQITEAAANKLIKGTDLKNFINTYVHKNGSIVPISWTARYCPVEQKMFCVARDISEKVFIREEAGKGGERYRALIQNSTDGLALLDKEGNILGISEPGKKILNIYKEDASENIRKNIHVEDVSNIEEAFFDVINDPEKSKKIEYRLKVNNEYKWIEAIFQNQFNEPTVNAIAVNFCDITDRKITEIALIKSEQLRKKIMNSALDAIICIDSRGFIIIWNDQAEKIFGWKREEVLGEPVVDLIIPQKFKERYHKGFKQYMETGEDPLLHKLIQGTAINRKKREFPVELFVIPIEQDSAMNFCAFIRDISTQKEVENLLQESEERYHKMIEEVDDYAILLLNNEGVIENWNKGAEKIKGYKEEEIIGKKVSVFYTEEDRKNNLPEQLLNQAIENGTISSDGWRVRKDGSLFWANVVLTALHDEDGGIIGFTKVTRDLTEKKKADEKLLKYMHELEASNIELEQFAYIASHDLQEPLRMVTSFLTQLEKKYKDQLDEKAQRYIYFATDGAARMRRIILDLLEYSRVGRKEYELEELDMDELMEEVVQFHRTIIKEKDAEIIWEDLPVIYAARTPVEQVLQNLIANAIKYQLPDVKPRVVIKSKELVKYWQFSVTDNGIGIEPEYFDKIFVLFQRLHQKEQYSGTGIGLAICKKIIENFRGRIWVESEEGKGSTFYFTIAK